MFLLMDSQVDDASKCLHPGKVDSSEKLTIQHDVFVTFGKDFCNTIQKFISTWVP